MEVRAVAKWRLFEVAKIPISCLGAGEKEAEEAKEAKAKRHHCLELVHGKRMGQSFIITSS